MNECIDLWRMYGHDYRVSWDPAYDTSGVPRHKLDPWYFVIHGRFGTVYPFGGMCLVCEIDNHNKIARKALENVNGSTLIQDGEYEKAIRFAAEYFPIVADILRLRRRKKLSQEQKEKCSRQLAKFKFRSIRT